MTWHLSLLTPEAPEFWEQKFFISELTHIKKLQVCPCILKFKSEIPWSLKHNCSTGILSYQYHWSIKHAYDLILFIYYICKTRKICGTSELSSLFIYISPFSIFINNPRQWIHLILLPSPKLAHSLPLQPSTIFGGKEWSTSYPSYSGRLWIQ